MQYFGFDRPSFQSDYFGFDLSVFDPVLLFADGGQGVFYDPSDLSTMFKDSAGTQPVTADGDPVGLIKDRSGNGNHAIAPNSAARPTYRTDGVLHWLQFDGVDDFLLCEDMSLIFDDFYIGVATQELARQNSSIYYMTLKSPTTRIQAHAPYGNGNAYFDTVSHIEGRISFAWPENTGGKAISSHYRNSGTAYARVNSIVRGNTNIASTLELEVLSIGAADAVSNLYNGNMFAFLTLFSDGHNDINKIENYLAKKAGVIL